MDLKIEYAKKWDLQMINKIFVEIVDSLKYYNEKAKRDEKNYFNLNELEKKLKEDKYSIIIIMDNNVIIGFCFSKYDDCIIWLEWVWLIEEYRWKKIINKILDSLEESAIKRNCHKIWCDSRTENISSLKAFQRNWYEIITTLKNHWYWQDFLLWQKFIKQKNCE